MGANVRIHRCRGVFVHIRLWYCAFACEKLVRTVLQNRVIRLIPACILFDLCKIALSYIPTMPPMQDFFLDLFSLSHWYIYAIVVYYLLAPAIYKIIDKRGGLHFSNNYCHIYNNLFLAI